MSFGPGVLSTARFVSRWCLWTLIFCCIIIRKTTSHFLIHFMFVKFYLFFVIIKKITTWFFIQFFIVFVTFNLCRIINKICMHIKSLSPHFFDDDKKFLMEVAWRNVKMKRNGVLRVGLFACRYNEWPTS